MSDSLDANNPKQMEMIPQSSGGPQSPAGVQIKSKEGTEINDGMEDDIVHTQKQRKYKQVILVFISRLLPGIALFGCIIYLIVLLSSPANWKTNAEAEDQVRLDRETNRGVFVSVCIAILMNVVGSFMFFIKVKESLVVTNYGFILGPVIGYLLDQGIGTDNGFQLFNTIEGWSYTFGTLIDGNFMRYIITVFLDLFISNPLQDIMKNQVKKEGVINHLQDPTGKYKFVSMYDKFVALNFPSILQSIIAFVTFQAYTNQTRFAWAYASEHLDRELRIPPGTIMICTAIAGVMYIVFYNYMDYISEREYFDLNVKLLYVLAILFLLYMLNLTNTIEAPVHGETDENLTAFLGNGRPVLGFLLFMCFFMYGFVYPLYTRIGCCGKCKPVASIERSDVLADADDEAGTLQEMKNQILDELISKLVQKGYDIRRQPSDMDQSKDANAAPKLMDKDM